MGLKQDLVIANQLKDAVLLANQGPQIVVKRKTAMSLSVSLNGRV